MNRYEWSDKEAEKRWDAGWDEVKSSLETIPTPVMTAIAIILAIAAIGLPFYIFR